MADLNFPQTTQPFVDERKLITPPWYYLLRDIVAFIQSATGGGVATGSTSAWAGTVVPDGYLLCDGAAVSRAAFATLFATIGTTWGPGNGTTTFNVPDFRGRTLFGVNGTSIPSVGSTGGAETVVLTTPNLPAHNHGINDSGHIHNVNDSGHVHGVGYQSVENVSGGSPLGVLGAGLSDSGSATTGISLQTAVTGITTQNTGSGTAVNKMPPWAGVLYVIKT